MLFIWTCKLCLVQINSVLLHRLQCPVQINRVLLNFLCVCSLQEPALAGPYAHFVLCFCVSTSLSFVGNSGHITCLCMQYFRVSEQWYGCQCLRFFHVHRKRVCTASLLWEKNPLPHRGLEPASVLHLAFQSDNLPTEISPPK